MRQKEFPWDLILLRDIEDIMTSLMINVCGRTMNTNPPRTINLRRFLALSHLFFTRLSIILVNTYRYAKNDRVTERFYSKIATFEWPFSRTLSKGKKGQAYTKRCAIWSGFLSTPFYFGVDAWSLLICSFLRSDRNLSSIKYVRYEAFFCG